MTAGRKILEVGRGGQGFDVRKNLVASGHYLKGAVLLDDIDQRAPDGDGGVVDVGNRRPILVDDELAGMGWLDVEVAVQNPEALETSLDVGRKEPRDQ